MPRNELRVIAGCDGAPAEPAPARVLLVAADRRFRMLASTSLTLRGYYVTVTTGTADVAELATRGRVDVAVIDATGSLTEAAREAARLRSARPRLGIVAVSDDSRPGLCAFPVLPRWGSFESLCGAIEQARGLADR
jgi:CheY-like chemotaxis protein